jgi:hypothetical protein
MIVEAKLSGKSAISDSATRERAMEFFAKFKEFLRHAQARTRRCPLGCHRPNPDSPPLKNAPTTSSLEDLRFDNYLEQSYRNAIDNGVHILSVFTGDMTRPTYREQMLDALFRTSNFKNLLKLNFFPSTDHVFSSENDRAKLFDLVLDWMISLNAQSELRRRARG